MSDCRGLSRKCTASGQAFMRRPSLPSVAGRRGHSFLRVGLASMLNRGKRYTTTHNRMLNDPELSRIATSTNFTTKANKMATTIPGDLAWEITSE